MEPIKHVLDGLSEVRATVQKPLSARQNEQSTRFRRLPSVPGFGRDPSS